MNLVDPGWRELMEMEVGGDRSSALGWAGIVSGKTSLTEKQRKKLNVSSPPNNKRYIS